MHRKSSTKIIIAILALFTLCLNETEAAVTRNDRVPFDQLFFDSCTREFVRVQGEMHVLMRSRTDRRGTVYDDVQIDLRGQGAGLISRNPYVLSQRLTVTFDNPPGCGSKRTLKRTTRLISKGP